MASKKKPKAVLVWALYKNGLLDMAPCNPIVAKDKKFLRTMDMEAVFVRIVPVTKKRRTKR